jgi:Lipase maturation factor
MHEVDMVLRQRQRAKDKIELASGDASESSTPMERAPLANSTRTSTSGMVKPCASGPHFHIAKWTILRLMGCMYLTVFAAAWFQNIGLMGEYGLLPASDYMQRLRSSLDDQSNWAGFVKYPSLFWWIPLTDNTMNAINAMGMLLSLIVVVGSINSWFVQLVLWLLYFTVVTTAGGTSFYQYGWESQILETGMLCVFLCTLPHIDLSTGRLRWNIVERTGSSHPPTATTLWLFQWLIFRISTGAGLIKIRGSSCWTLKTCLYYHFETQPIPSPLSFLYHFAPRFVQRRMIDIDLFVQLYTAWMVLIPAYSVTWLPRPIDRCLRWIGRLGGFLQAFFMVGILLSGNFSVLNHLTIIPALACLDNACWPRFMQRGRGRRSSQTNWSAREAATPWTRRCIDVAILSLVLYLSRPVIDNLLQRGGHRHQLMNASFDSFRLVNTYGAFGSVGEARYEAIVQTSDDGESWTELEFPCKPGNVYRAPCFCAPYHYRLDWNIWFLGFKPHQSFLRSRESWLYGLLYKILQGGHEQPTPWLSLLDSSSQEFLRTTYYQHGKAPKYAKVDMYHYKMAEPLWTILERKRQALFSHADVPVAWWIRKFDEPLIPTVSLESFR